MEIHELGKGAILQPIDERDFSFEIAAIGASPVDFSVEVLLPEPPNENQGTSQSCVAQATSYLHWQIDQNKDFSRRDIYSQIALPGGGAYLRDGVKRLVDFGQATRDEVPDPQPETEMGMLDKTGVSAAKETSDKESSYFIIQDSSINGVALAVRDYHGAIFGIYGNDAGFVDLDNPVPPVDNTKIEWGHALYAMGFHLHDGKKCIIAKSSWCDGQRHIHHINEDWFTKGMTFNAWAVIHNSQLTMSNSQIVKNGGEYGVYDPATSEDGLVTLALNRGLTIPYTTDPNGKEIVDFVALDGLIKSVLVPK